MRIQAKSFCAMMLGLACGCAHNKQVLDQTKASAAPPSAAQVATTQNYSPEMRRKLAQAEQLKKLQVEVYELQDQVYGNTEYGSMGLYGALRECKLGLADKKNGGSGALTWSEPMDRVADKEPRLSALDDPEQLKQVSEQTLIDRKKRFEDARAVLGKRQDDLEDKLEICRGELKAHKDQDSTSPSYIQHEREDDTQEAL